MTRPKLIDGISQQQDYQEFEGLRELQKRLSEHREKERLFDHSQALGKVGSWEWDPIKNKFEVSNELHRIYGVLPGSIQTFSDLLAYTHPDDLQFLKRTANGWYSFSLEYRIMRPDMEQRFLLVKAERVLAGQTIKLHAIVQDITGHKNSVHKLETSKERLQALSRYLLSSREEEKIKIAKEIHDDVGQVLSALKIDLTLLNREISRAYLGGDVRDFEVQTMRMSRLVDGTIQTIRRMVTALHPEVLEVMGLTAAIEWFSEGFEKNTGIAVQLLIDPETIIDDRSCQITVFRIFQEALNNVAKHAKATNVTVKLEEVDGHFVLSIRDNGKGISKEDLTKSGAFGLLKTRERVLFLGGIIDIYGKPNEGTIVNVRIPLNIPRNGLRHVQGTRNSGT